MGLFGLTNDTPGYTKCAWCGKTCKQTGWNRASAWVNVTKQYCSEQCRRAAESVEDTGDVDNLEEVNEKREERITQQRIDGHIDSIVSIQFGTTAEDISNALNQLITIAAGKPSKEVKKATYEKMEFAIMKLRQLGAYAEADFFEKKRTKVKPKWYESLTNN